MAAMISCPLLPHEYAGEVLGRPTNPTRSDTNDVGKLREQWDDIERGSTATVKREVAFYNSSSYTSFVVLWEPDSFTRLRVRAIDSSATDSAGAKDGLNLRV
jgi:hypothetical protein